MCVALAWLHFFNHVLLCRDLWWPIASNGRRWALLNVNLFRDDPKLSLERCTQLSDQWGGLVFQRTSIFAILAGTRESMLWWCIYVLKPSHSSWLMSQSRLVYIPKMSLFYHFYLCSMVNFFISFLHLPEPGCLLHPSAPRIFTQASKMFWSNVAQYNVTTENCLRMCRLVMEFLAFPPGFAGVTMDGCRRVTFGHLGGKRSPYLVELLWSSSEINW